MRAAILMSNPIVPAGIRNTTTRMPTKSENLIELQRYITHAVIFNTVVVLLIFYFYLLLNNRHPAIMAIASAIQVILMLYVSIFIYIIYFD